MKQCHLFFFHVTFLLPEFIETVIATFLDTVFVTFVDTLSLAFIISSQEIPDVSKIDLKKINSHYPNKCMC